MLSNETKIDWQFINNEELLKKLDTEVNQIASEYWNKKGLDNYSNDAGLHSENNITKSSLLECQDAVQEYLLSLIEKITNDRGYEHKNNNVDTFMNGVIDAALSMQSTICASESLGLGVCPISLIRNIIEEVKVICKLPKGVFPIAGLAVGWPDQKSNVSIRLS